MQLNPDPSIIDLGVGQPQLSLLPLQSLQQAAEKLFARGDTTFLQYGAERGDGYLQIELAHFLRRRYGFPVDVESMLITNGSSQGLDLVCTLFTKPGDVIIIEEPSYFLALHIFADHGLRVVPIPVDEDGLVVDALEDALTHTRPVFLYTIPTFQNPTGYILPQERRQRLAALSLEYDFLIVADEVYHFLNYGASLPIAFAGYTEQGNVISLGSFSKILAPGLRLGWLQASKERIKAITKCGLLDSGGGLNPFTSAIVRGVLEDGGMETHLDELRAVYSARVRTLDAALQEHLPEVSYHFPQGGYFFWVRLPDGRNAEELLSDAAKFKVSFKPGIRFSSQGGKCDHMRLCFAYYEAEALVQGVERLKRAMGR